MTKRSFSLIYGTRYPQLVNTTNWNSTIIGNIVRYTPPFMKMRGMTIGIKTSKQFDYIASGSATSSILSCDMCGTIKFIVVLLQSVIFLVCVVTQYNA